MINLRLAIALFLLAPIAYAITPDAPVEELLDAGVRAWGDWPVVLGVAVALLVRAALTARPLWLEEVPSRWRPAIAIVLAGLPAFAGALMLGDGWRVAIVALVQAFAGAAGTVEALRLAFGKPPMGAQ